ncbi:12534_t:CDS:2 [Acaulospora colombiana]|uniref:12534_t:CDS:1 n=1 Tax=Acaulospora colombiana TaxID=27376 RepID=A0ACA9NMB9_9GLOM|nr:12534_t:CDS:2 [Acaulospora colombiana]
MSKRRVALHEPGHGLDYQTSSPSGGHYRVASEHERGPGP